MLLKASRLLVPPFDYKNLKHLFGGLVIANNGFDKPRANKAIADGRADLIAFGKPFIANPDLLIRLFLDAPLMRQHPVNSAATLFRGSDRGRRLSVRPLVGNDLFQALDAIFGEGCYAIL
ncbi:MAG TPA: hypothetical protein VLZ74_08955, partial [Methylocella sp.]|nr:hypothetical protein [Methylocella sp.]